MNQHSRQTSEAGADTGANVMSGEKVPVHVWAPFTAVFVVLLLHVVWAVLSNNFAIIFLGQALGLATYFLMRLAFPRPDEE